MSQVLFKQNKKLGRIISEVPSCLNLLLKAHLQTSECPANDMEMSIPVGFLRKRDFFTFCKEETFLNAAVYK